MFIHGQPTENVVIDNFLPISIAYDLYNECVSLDQTNWTKFTRNNSHMQECKNLSNMVAGKRFVEEMHSSETVKWLEDLTGISGLIPDPHITGAGYSRSFRGDTLQVHNDFNWNEQLRLHRAISLILYITPEWDPEWGGSLDFYDLNKDQIVKTVDCVFNRLLIWKYHNRNFHGYTTPLSCPAHISRNTIRLFYYTSNSTHNPVDLPHRSQYWYDRTTNTPYDKRDQK